MKLADGSPDIPGLALVHHLSHHGGPPLGGGGAGGRGGGGACPGVGVAAL